MMLKTNGLQSLNLILNFSKKKKSLSNWDNKNKRKKLEMNLINKFNKKIFKRDKNKMKNFNTANYKNCKWETLMKEKNKRKMKEEKRFFTKRNQGINN